MLKFFRRPTGKSTTPAPPAAVEPLSAPHRQRYAVEVAYFGTAGEMTECLAVPVGGRRVVLFGGGLPLPAVVSELSDRAVALSDADPFAGAVAAVGGLRDGDTLTVLLPADWSGPPPEMLIDHARRWFTSPHSREDELRVG